MYSNFNPNFTLDEIDQLIAAGFYLTARADLMRRSIPGTNKMLSVTPYHVAFEYRGYWIVVIEPDSAHKTGINVIDESTKYLDSIYDVIERADELTQKFTPGRRTAPLQILPA